MMDYVMTRKICASKLGNEVPGGSCKKSGSINITTIPPDLWLAGDTKRCCVPEKALVTAVLRGNVHGSRRRGDHKIAARDFD